MSATPQNASRWLTVVLFAIAFAWIESAAALYLRTLVDRVEPYQLTPLPAVETLAWVEIVREAATMVLLATVGVLAGRNRVSRLGYTTIAFGVWDVCYYVFLKATCGWPHSLLDWDVLFLLPLPWWGPVLAPTLIALLMIIWGTLVTQIEALQPRALFNRTIVATGFLGVLLALYVFVADAVRVAPLGEAALSEMLPAQFNWLLFVVALVLMAVPIVQLLVELVRQRSRGDQACGEKESSPTRKGNT